MSWWRWNVNPKFPTAADIEAVRRQIREAAPGSLIPIPAGMTIADLDAQMLAEEKLHPSCMWDWISPARIKRPYE